MLHASFNLLSERSDHEDSNSSKHSDNKRILLYVKWVTLNLLHHKQVPVLLLEILLGKCGLLEAVMKGASIRMACFCCFLPQCDWIGMY